MSLGADKGCDTATFLAGVRDPGATPHVARKKRCSALDGRSPATRLAPGSASRYNRSQPGTDSIHGPACTMWSIPCKPAKKLSPCGEGKTMTNRCSATRYP